ncbi:hypothetical protein [Ereboglobus luteus]|nr:hypothetical protein [Ereboglobus luteus]
MPRKIAPRPSFDKRLYPVIGMETLPNTIKPAELGSGFSGGKMPHVKLFYRKTRAVRSKQSRLNKTVSALKNQKTTPRPIQNSVAYSFRSLAKE